MRVSELLRSFGTLASRPPFDTNLFVNEAKSALNHADAVVHSEFMAQLLASTLNSLRTECLSKAISRQELDKVTRAVSVYSHCMNSMHASSKLTTRRSRRRARSLSKQS